MQDLAMLLSGRADFWMSLLVILGVLAMPVYFYIWIRGEIRKDAGRAAQAAKSAVPADSQP